LVINAGGSDTTYDKSSREIRVRHGKKTNKGFFEKYFLFIGNFFFCRHFGCIIGGMALDVFQDDVHAFHDFGELLEDETLLIEKRLMLGEDFLGVRNGWSRSLPFLGWWLLGSSSGGVLLYIHPFNKFSFVVTSVGLLASGALWTLPVKAAVVVRGLARRRLATVLALWALGDGRHVLCVCVNKKNERRRKRV